METTIGTSRAAFLSRSAKGGLALVAGGSPALPEVYTAAQATKAVTPFLA